MLLADASEKLLLRVYVAKSLRCLKFYGLDPCHYFSSPGVSWDAMLKMTGVQLEQMSDMDMLLFNEIGLRGGIYNIAKRYSKAKHKYMKNL